MGSFEDEARRALRVTRLPRVSPYAIGGVLGVLGLVLVILMPWAGYLMVGLAVVVIVGTFLSRHGSPSKGSDEFVDAATQRLGQEVVSGVVLMIVFYAAVSVGLVAEEMYVELGALTGLCLAAFVLVRLLTVERRRRRRRRN